LVFLRDGATVDIAVVDQMRGPTRRCDWLEWGHVDIEGGRVATCGLVGDAESRLITPDGCNMENRSALPTDLFQMALKERV